MKKQLLLISLMALGVAIPLCGTNSNAPLSHRQNSTINSTQKLSAIRKKPRSAKLYYHRQRLNKNICINSVVEQSDSVDLLKTIVEASSTSAVRTIILGATGPIGSIGETILNEVITLAREHYQEENLNHARFCQALKTIILSITINMGLGPLAEIPGVNGIVRNILSQQLQTVHNSLKNYLNPQAPQQPVNASNNSITKLAHQASEEVTGDLVDNGTTNIIENVMQICFNS